MAGPACRSLLRLVAGQSSLPLKKSLLRVPTTSLPHRRGLLTPSQPPTVRTAQEVVEALTHTVIAHDDVRHIRQSILEGDPSTSVAPLEGGPATYDPDGYNKQREELMNILPQSQEELPPRRMLDSYDSAIIPLGSDPKLRDRYLNPQGGVRIGRLLEDMDVFAVHLVFKHVLNPKQGPETPSPFSIVTALVDQIDFTASFRADCDIRMSGHVTWVGKSSAESTLQLEQLVDGQWRRCTEATFVLVARDPLNRGSAFINPLEVEGQEEEDLFQKGEHNKIRRYEISQDSLFKVPPNLEEQDIIHDFFLNTIDHKAMSFKARVKPGNSVWMEDAKLKNLIVCQPQNRNRFNKIFGGFIMRQAFELAWANSYVFGQCRPWCMHMDDIWFRSPVEIGAMLYFNSQICYVQDNFIQSRVSAEVLDPKTGLMTVTNVFHFTFLAKEKTPPLIVPKTYHEAMMYLTGRRHFKSSTHL